MARQCSPCAGKGYLEEWVNNGRNVVRYGCESCGGARGDGIYTGQEGRGFISGSCATCEGSGEGAETRRRKRKAGIARFLTAAIARTGFLVAFLSLGEAGEETPIPTPHDFLKTSGFELGTGDKALRQLNFRLAVKTLSELRTELWLDPTKLVPAKILTSTRSSGTAPSTGNVR